MENENTPSLDLGSFDFTPAWAKQDAGVTARNIRPQDDGDPREARGHRPGGGAGRKPFGDRKPFDRDRKPFGDRKPSDRGDRDRGGERPGAGRRPFDRGTPRFERPKPLEADVKVLPDSRALGTIIRKLQQDYHAYKLKDLAYFFLDNPTSVLLKVTSKPGAAPLAFCQCKACGFAATSEDAVVAHILTAHLGDYYEAREIACEPPKGNFNCVAKCGLTGVLLGPPNIHEFNDVVREMVRTKFPEMGEQQYRAHIEMLRDAESIEEWRKQAVKKTVYVAKGAGEEAPNLTREQAEGEFRRNILPSMLEHPKNLMITVDVALQSPDRPLQWAARDALEQERRAPYNMCFALRGAFHHRKLNFFRANDARGQEFVCGVELKPFDAAHAIPELAKVATFVAEHPCSPKIDIAPDPETEKHLTWLATTGHVVAFTNGVYSAVEKFPKYGPQWQKRGKKEKIEAEVEVEKVEAEVEVENKVETEVEVENKVETEVEVEKVEAEVEKVEKVEKQEEGDRGTGILPVPQEQSAPEEPAPAV